MRFYSSFQINIAFGYFDDRLAASWLIERTEESALPSSLLVPFVFPPAPLNTVHEPFISPSDEWISGHLSVLTLTIAGNFRLFSKSLVPTCDGLRERGWGESKQKNNEKLGDGKDCIDFILYTLVGDLYYNMLGLLASSNGEILFVRKIPLMLDCCKW